MAWATLCVERAGQLLDNAGPCAQGFGPRRGAGRSGGQPPANCPDGARGKGAKAAQTAVDRGHESLEARLARRRQGVRASGIARVSWHNCYLARQERVRLGPENVDVNHTWKMQDVPKLAFASVIIAKSCAQH
jgi:hypothetical protein